MGHESGRVSYDFCELAASTPPLREAKVNTGAKAMEISTVEPLQRTTCALRNSPA